MKKIIIIALMLVSSAYVMQAGDAAQTPREKILTILGYIENGTWDVKKLKQPMFDEYVAKHAPDLQNQAQKIINKKLYPQQKTEKSWWQRYDTEWVKRNKVRFAAVCAISGLIGAMLAKGQIDAARANDAERWNRNFTQTVVGLMAHRRALEANIREMQGRPQQAQQPAPQPVAPLLSEGLYARLRDIVPGTDQYRALYDRADRMRIEEVIDGRYPGNIDERLVHRAYELGLGPQLQEVLNRREKTSPSLVPPAYDEAAAFVDRVAPRAQAGPAEQPVVQVRPATPPAIMQRGGRGDAPERPVINRGNAPQVDQRLQDLLARVRSGQQRVTQLSSDDYNALHNLDANLMNRQVAAERAERLGGNASARPALSRSSSSSSISSLQSEVERRVAQASDIGARMNIGAPVEGTLSREDVDNLIAEIRAGRSILDISQDELRAVSAVDPQLVEWALAVEQEILDEGSDEE